MKSVMFSFVVGAAVLASGVASAELSAVKIECWGDCSRVDAETACREGGVQRYPLSISCDDTTDADWGAAAAPCGSATCKPGSQPNNHSTVSNYCFDGGGHDAIVMCSTNQTNDVSYYSVHTGIARVECNGDCNGVTLQQVCDTFGTGFGYSPIGVACDDAADPGQGPRLSCGNGLTCTPWGTLVRSDPLGAYCADGGGYDAVVTCSSALSTSLVGAVKVETWGDPSQVRLGEICDTYRPDSHPISVSCDDTDGGQGSSYTCGNDATCTSTPLTRDAALSSFCADGWGNDAVVMCSTGYFP